MSGDLSTADVATLCAVSTEEVRDWIQTRLLQATKGLDKKWKITEESLSDFLATPGELRRIFLRRRNCKNTSVLVFAPAENDIAGLEDLKRDPGYTLVHHTEITLPYESMTRASLMYMLFDCVIVDPALGSDSVRALVAYLKKLKTDGCNQRSAIFINVWDTSDFTRDTQSPTETSDLTLFDYSHYRSGHTEGYLEEQIRLYLCKLAAQETTD